MLRLLWWQELLTYIDSKPSIVQRTPLHYMLQLRQQFTPNSNIVLTGHSQERYFGFSGWRAFLFGTNACLRSAIIPTGGIVLPDHPFIALQVPESEN